MKKEIIINATSSELRVAITEDGRLAELFLELPDKERHVGSIFLGRVERVVQGMNAAFVDIGLEQHAFLHFSDAANAGEDFTDLLTDDDDEEQEKPKGSRQKPQKGQKKEQPRPAKQEPGKGRAEEKPGKGLDGKAEPRPEKGDRRKGDDRADVKGKKEAPSRDRAGGRDRGPREQAAPEGKKATPEADKGRPERREDRERQDGRDREGSRGEERPAGGEQRRDREQRGRDEGRERRKDERKAETVGGERDNRRGPQKPSTEVTQEERRDQRERDRQPAPPKEGERREERPTGEEGRGRPRGDRPPHERRKGAAEGERGAAQQAGKAEDAGTQPAAPSGERESEASGRQDRRRKRPGRGAGKKQAPSEEPAGQTASATDEGRGEAEQRESVESGPQPEGEGTERGPEENGNGEGRKRSRRRRGGRRKKSGRAGEAQMSESADGQKQPDATTETTGGGRGEESRDASIATPSPRGDAERASDSALATEGEKPSSKSGQRRSGRSRPSRKGAGAGDAATDATDAKATPQNQDEDQGESGRRAKEDSGDRGRDARSDEKSAPSDNAGQSDAPAPKKPSGRRRPARKKPSGGGSGPNDAGKPSNGGSRTMDAKLPTFSTKRHGEITIALERGQDVLVQVTRESYASKGVKVSTKISLPGRFIVLLPLDPMIGISRKVLDIKERRRLRGIARKMLPEDFGCIIRTVAQDKDSEMLEQELQMLLDRWKTIEETLKTVNEPGIVYRDQSVANTVMRDLFTPDVARVVIDNRNLYNEIRDYVTWAAPTLLDKVEYYSGRSPIFQHFEVEKELDKMLTSKVWLPTGGYIILEQTEAMMVIDVNSGRYAKDKEQEINALKTNLDAAREIARQIRLRDIGGLLVVDFIDLYDEKNRKKVYDELKKEMSRDRAKSVILPMTQFGIVQMTRQRVRQQLVQTMSEPCPTCNGKGIVQSKSTIVRRIERWLSNFRSQSREFRLTLTASPHIIEYLTDGDSMSRLTKMMLRHFVRVKVVPDESLGMEQFRFYSIRRQEDVTEEYMPK